MEDVNSAFGKANAEAFRLLTNLFRDIALRKIDPESEEYKERKREVDRKQKEASELLTKIKESKVK